MVIGGGSTGASALYHLVTAGCRFLDTSHPLIRSSQLAWS
jgi:hypothetical protein